MNITKKVNQTFSFVIDGVQHDDFEFDSNWEGFSKYSKSYGFIIVAENVSLSSWIFKNIVDPKVKDGESKVTLISCSQFFMPKDKK